jgi:hypothetical protein
MSFCKCIEYPTVLHVNYYQLNCFDLFSFVSVQILRSLLSGAEAIKALMEACHCLKLKGLILCVKFAFLSSGENAKFISTNH